MPESRQENINFTLLPQNYLPFGWGRGGGVMKFTISFLLALQMLQPKLGKDWPSSSCQ